MYLLRISKSRNASQETVEEYVHLGFRLRLMCLHSHHVPIGLSQKLSQYGQCVDRSLFTKVEVWSDLFKIDFCD